MVPKTLKVTEVLRFLKEVDKFAQMSWYGIENILALATGV